MTDFSDDNLVCRCFAIPACVIRDAIRKEDLHHVEEVTACTRAGGGCSSCWDDIQAILDAVHGKSPSRHAPDETGLSAAQKRTLIAQMIEEEMQKLLDLNHLQLQLIDVAANRVLIRFSGEGVGTPAASFLSIKRFLVKKMTDVCGQKMNLIELNVLEQRVFAAKSLKT